MNDSFSGKKGNKVNVMYVRGEEKSHDNKKRHAGSVSGCDNTHQNTRHRNGSRWDKSSRRPQESGCYDSPWKKVYCASAETPLSESGGISGKSSIDPEQLRRQRAEESKVYGENACQALFSNRPDAIVRAWFMQSVTPRFRKTLLWMAENRKAYHVVDEEELTKISATEHHGGVCFLIKKRCALNVVTYLQQASSPDCILALEAPGNPHNLGGIMRSCAHFGVNALLLRNPDMLESGAAVRTAEGGAEHIKAIRSDDFLAELESFRRAGYTIVTTSSHKGTSLSEVRLPSRIVLVLGHEGDGLPDTAWQQGDLKVVIGGTGRVNSLNISVATGILLAQWWLQNGVVQLSCMASE